MIKQRVDIIGAGVSGLTTAYYLARALDPRHGVQIHVWERDAIPGGLAGSFQTQNFIVEKFYHHLFRRDTALRELISAVGLEDNLVWRPAATGAYYFQQPYRLSSPLDLLRFKPLPLLDRLRLGWLAIHAHTVREWQTLDECSVKEYIVRVAGENVYQVVWEPLLHGKFGKYAEQVSAAWLWSKLVDRGGSRNAQGHELLGYLRGGLGRVFEAIVEQLREMGHRVHLGTPVQAFESSSDRVTAILTDEGRIETEVVVGCAQVPDIVALLPDATGDYRTALRDIHFLSNICLVLTLNRSLSDFYWTNVTDPTAPFVGIVEQTNWAERQEFNQKHVVYVSAYTSADDPRLQMSTEALIQHYLPTITNMFPDFTKDCIEEAACWTAPYAQPIVDVGYRHRVPQMHSPLQNLFICTMAQIYPHDRQVSNGVELARKTAECVNSYLEANGPR